MIIYKTTYNLWLNKLEHYKNALYKFQSKYRNIISTQKQSKGIQKFKGFMRHFKAQKEEIL